MAQLPRLRRTPLNRITDRIHRLRAKFAIGLTGDRRPYPKFEQEQTHRELVLTPEQLDLYELAIQWAEVNRHLRPEEVDTVRMALLNWETVDLATRVTVTKTCNELLEKRGDA